MGVPSDDGRLLGKAASNHSDKWEASCAHEVGAMGRDDDLRALLGKRLQNARHVAGLRRVLVKLGLLEPKKKVLWSRVACFGEFLEECDEQRPLKSMPQTPEFSQKIVLA